VTYGKKYMFGVKVLRHHEGIKERNTFLGELS
jgi:hypothetical protein